MLRTNPIPNKSRTHTLSPFWCIRDWRRSQALQNHPGQNIYNHIPTHWSDQETLKREISTDINNLLEQSTTQKWPSQLGPCSTTHYSPPLHQLKKNKPVIPLFSNAHFTPPPLRSPCFRAKFGTFTNPSSSRQLRFSVKANNHFSFCFFTFWVYVLWDSFCIVWLFFLVFVGCVSEWLFFRRWGAVSYSWGISTGGLFFGFCDYSVRFYLVCLFIWVLLML